MCVSVCARGGAGPHKKYFCPNLAILCKTFFGGLAICNAQDFMRGSIMSKKGHPSSDRMAGVFLMIWNSFRLAYTRWLQTCDAYFSRGSCSQDYYDAACRYNSTSQYHNPPLLYNLNTDPGEIHPLDSRQYSAVLHKIGMVSPHKKKQT